MTMAIPVTSGHYFLPSVNLMPVNFLEQKKSAICSNNGHGKNTTQPHNYKGQTYLVSEGPDSGFNWNGTGQHFATTVGFSGPGSCSTGLKQIIIISSHVM